MCCVVIVKWYLQHGVSCAKVLGPVTDLRREMRHIFLSAKNSVNREQGVLISDNMQLLIAASREGWGSRYR